MHVRHRSPAVHHSSSSRYFLPAVLVCTLCTALQAIGAQAQSPAQPAAAHEFEVASVKPNLSSTMATRGVQFAPGGRVSATNVTLWAAILAAYDLSLRQLSDGPKLLDEKFDIDARAGANALGESAPAEARNQQLRLMLQALLADRFKLAMHKETKELPIYALVIGSGGPRLKPAPDGRECPAAARCERVGGGPAAGLTGLDARLSDLAEALTAFSDRDVIDRTEIQGHFDFDLPPWNPSVQSTAPAFDDPEPRASASDPSIFTVLQERLGLRLQPTRGPIDVYVVDRVEPLVPDR
jgi:uncharacterized protein (TIGR03435 family)